MKQVEVPQPVKAKPSADLPPVSLKKGAAGGMPLEMDFFSSSKGKASGMAAAFKEFDELQDSAVEEKKEDGRSFAEVLREKREKTEAALQAA